MAKPSKIEIGTSGWNYASWKEKFYTRKIRSGERLAFYADVFPTVELNNSFYKLPSRNSVRTWHGTVPGHFVFSVKASRYLTHMKKLKDAGQGLKRFFHALEPFGKKLGPVLFQLPPSWHVNTERLEKFLSRLPGKKRYVFEFRDKSWFCRPVYDLLRQYRAGLCFYDYKGWQSPETVTAEFIYLRLHGPRRKAYGGHYHGRVLRKYARKMIEWKQEGKQVYCYFDNDRKACAPADALKLAGYVKEMSGS